MKGSPVLIKNKMFSFIVHGASADARPVPRIKRVHEEKVSTSDIWRPFINSPVTDILKILYTENATTVSKENSDDGILNMSARSKTKVISC